MKEDGSFEIETKIKNFLANCGKDHDAMEEEKHHDEYEEEEKEVANVTQKTQKEQAQVDTMIFYMAAAFVIKPWSQWHELKQQFVAGILKTCKKIQTNPEEHQKMVGENLSDSQQKMLDHSLPLIQILGFFDQIKSAYDKERLAIEGDKDMQAPAYVNKLRQEICKDDLDKEVILSAKVFDTWKTKLQKQNTLPELLETLGVKNEIEKEAGDSCLAWAKNF